MRKFKFSKLVRDKIVDNIISVGNKPNWKILSDTEFIRELKNKIVEESAEVPRNNDPKAVVEELADLQELIDNLLSVFGVSKSEFRKIKTNKNKERGSFKKRLYIEDVETTNKVTKWVKYYLDNPDKYPEIK